MSPTADVDDPAPLFFWQAGITEPDGFFDNDTFDLFDKLEDALVCLYPAINGYTGRSSGGLW